MDVDNFIAQQEAIEKSHRPEGCVYFCKIGDRVKIGFTHGIKSRMTLLYSQTKQEVLLLAKLPAQPEIEKMIHGYFKAHRIEGEWFRPEKEIFMFAEKIRNKQITPEWVIYNWRRD